MLRRKSAIFFILIFVTLSSCKKESKEKPDWAKKDIRDFSDADMERLLDQWEEDEEPLPDDELPEYKRPPAQPNFNFDNLGKMGADDIMKMSKKGKTVMMFVNINGEPSRQETETITSLWQGALHNDHIQAERYVIDDARAIFMFHDGAQAWDAKGFLIEQERLKDITLEGQNYEGKYSNNKNTNAKAEL